MPQTFAEKALARAAGLDSVRAGQIVDVEPDIVLSHDNTAAIARIFRTLGRERVRHPHRLAVTLDHAVPAPTALHAANHAEVRRFVAEQNIEHFFEAGRGICHQVLGEEALIWPGQVILGADSHTTHFGWLGAFGAGVGRSEVAALWATGKLWLRLPESLTIELTGALLPGVTAKDLALHVLRILDDDIANYSAIEFSGPGLASLSVESRMVLPNVMAEAGAKNAYLPADDLVFGWLSARLSARIGKPEASCRDLLTAAALYPDPDANYAARYSLDLSALEPLVAVPHHPANVRPLSEVAGTRVQQAFIGTCTNGRLEDLAAAATILRRQNGSVRRLAPGTRLLVIPASQQVYREALAAGYIDTFLQAGAMLGTPGCGPCMGNHMGVPAPGEVTISTGNRNFRGRMGAAESDIYLASPAIVAASALAGYITGPGISSAGRVSSNQLSVNSDRRQKTTTQSTGQPPIPSTQYPVPNRAWKYGDNVNTDVIFPGKYTYTLRTPEEWAQHALEDLDPAFAAGVQPGDVVVGGWNWGCGSSREQAVGCLRAAGVRVIIAASFARIYYRNAINNGLLAIVCPEAVAAIQPGESLHIDVENNLIHCAAGAFPFPPLSPSLQRIIEAGGIVSMLQIGNHTASP